MIESEPIYPNPIHQIRNAQQGFDGSFFVRAYTEVASQGGAPSLTDVWEKIPPEGIAITSAITLVSLSLVVPIEAGITAVVKSATTSDGDLARTAAVGLSVAANAASMFLEAKTLREKKYSSSPGGVILNAVTDEPLASSIAEHGLNLALLAATNPINYVALYNNDTQLLTDSLIASSLTVPLWNTIFNLLILKGRIDPVVEEVKKIKNKISQTLKRGESSGK